MRTLLLRCCLAVAVAVAAAPLPPAAAADDSADFLTSNIDAAVHPGDDFFRHANGRWIQRNPIPPSEASSGITFLVNQQLYGALRVVHDEAAAAPSPAGDDQVIGDFWRTAMDTALAEKQGIKPLEIELARIDAVKNLRQAIDAAFALQPIGVGALFSFWIDQDLRDSSAISVYAWQGGLGLPDRDFYLSTAPEIARTRAEYQKYLAKLLRLLGRSEAKATAAAKAVVAFETQLAKAARALEDTRDSRQNYHPLAPDVFTRLHTPSIDWASRLAAWNLRPAFIAVGQPEYFDGLDRALARTPIAVLKDYLRLRLLDAYAPDLSARFDAAWFDFHGRVLNGQTEPRPRWQRILDSETGFDSTPHPIGMLVGRRYVAAHFTAQTKERYAAMTRAILAAYGERIARLPWMTEATKVRALEKLAAMNVKVGYPDRWLDTTHVRIGRDAHATNTMSIARWRFVYGLGRYGKPVDRTEWRMAPQTYNAYYNASANEIVLPAAVFIVPGMADADVDDAVAYAYAGYTIGHEITHGFDDDGRHFDGRGNLTDWWTAQDEAEFNKRADVLVKQYDAMEPLPGYRINGKATLSENIADLGGLAIALDAFKQTAQYRNGTVVAGRSPLQRFFLAYAHGWLSATREERLRLQLLSDAHAPAQARVNGAVANVDEFFEAFEVTKGRALWREAGERARVW